MVVGGSNFGRMGRVYPPSQKQRRVAWAEEGEDEAGREPTTHHNLHHIQPHTPIFILTNKPHFFNNSVSNNLPLFVLLSKPLIPPGKLLAPTKRHLFPLENTQKRGGSGDFIQISVGRLPVMEKRGPCG